MTDAMETMSAWPGWPRSCPSCGADLVDKHFVEVFSSGPITRACVNPDGTLSRLPGKRRPGDSIVACGNCGAGLKPNRESD